MASVARTSSIATRAALPMVRCCCCVSATPHWPPSRRWYHCHRHEMVDECVSAQLRRRVVVVCVAARRRRRWSIRVSLSRLRVRRSGRKGEVQQLGAGAFCAPRAHDDAAQPSCTRRTVSHADTEGGEEEEQVTWRDRNTLIRCVHSAILTPLRAFLARGVFDVHLTCICPPACRAREQAGSRRLQPHALAVPRPLAASEQRKGGRDWRRRPFGVMLRLAQRTARRGLSAGLLARRGSAARHGGSTRTATTNPLLATHLHAPTMTRLASRHMHHDSSPIQAITLRSSNGGGREASV